MLQASLSFGHKADMGTARKKWQKNIFLVNSFLVYSILQQVRLVNAVSAKRIPKKVITSRLKENSLFSYEAYIYLLKARMAPFFSAGGSASTATSGSFSSVSFCPNWNMSSLGVSEWCITISGICPLLAAFENDSCSAFSKGRTPAPLFLICSPRDGSCSTFSRGRHDICTGWLSDDAVTIVTADKLGNKIDEIQSHDDLGCVSVRKSKIGFLSPKESENGFYVSLLNRSIQDLSDHVRQRNRRMHFQCGIFGSFDAPWSERSWIDLSCKETKNPFSDSFGFKNPIVDFLKKPTLNGQLFFACFVLFSCYVTSLTCLLEFCVQLHLYQSFYLRRMF